jgi:hypothetical protein
LRRRAAATARLLTRPPDWQAEGRYMYAHTMSGDTVVPPGRVWLQGDNIRNSTDSRNYGPVRSRRPSACPQQRQARSSV